jgi:HNH/Endo VII superfamily nuclease toxin with a HHH motif
MVADASSRQDRLHDEFASGADGPLRVEHVGVRDEMEQVIVVLRAYLIDDLDVKPLHFIIGTASLIKQIPEEHGAQACPDIVRQVIGRLAAVYGELELGPIVDVSRLGQQLISLGIVSAVSDRCALTIQDLEEEELAQLPHPLLRSRSGFSRTDWRRTRDLWDRVGIGDILSDANRARIAAGRTPVVDEAWVRHVPGDKALIGEKIPMHHVGGSPITVPLPASRHIDAHMPGGYRYNPGGPGASG